MPVHAHTAAAFALHEKRFFVRGKTRNGDPYDTEIDIISNNCYSNDSMKSASGGGMMKYQLKIEVENAQRLFGQRDV